MRSLNKNKLSNSYDRKMFSSVNLAFIIFTVSVIVISIYQGLNDIKGWSLFKIACLIFFIVNIMILIKNKFPVFISRNPVEELDLENYTKKHEKNIGFWGSLYLIMFTAEPSCFASLFSGTTLTLYQREKNNTFIWHSNNTKLIHRVLDFILMVVAILVSYVLITYCFKTAILAKALMIVLTIITLAFKLEKTILFNMFSVELEEKEGIKLKVLYNYSTSKIRINNFYGIAEPWTKSVIIGSNDIDPVAREFTIAHETGHIKDKRFIFMNTFIALFEVIYIFGMLFALDRANQNIILAFFSFILNV